MVILILRGGCASACLSVCVFFFLAFLCIFFNAPAMCVAIQAVVHELKEWFEGAKSCAYACKAQASARVDVPTAR